MSENEYPFQYRILGRVVGSEEWKTQTTNRNIHGIWFTARGAKVALAQVARIKRKVPGVWERVGERHVKKTEDWEFKIQYRPAETEWTDI